LIVIISLDKSISWCVIRCWRKANC